jgi:putative ABC transport system substrate-binding protein
MSCVSTGLSRGNLVVIPEGFGVIDDNLAERAAALVKAAPDAIVPGPVPLRALQALTRTIPFIGMTEDMVAEGLVQSLAHPGANTTGISLLSPELDGKRQDILIEAAPGARRIAAMADSKVTPTLHIEALQQGARSRGVELTVFSVKIAADGSPRFGEAAGARRGALYDAALARALDR